MTKSNALHVIDDKVGFRRAVLVEAKHRGHVPSLQLIIEAVPAESVVQKFREE